MISEAKATTLNIHETRYEDASGNTVNTDFFVSSADLSDYEAPEAPIRIGYVFVGWSYTLPDETPDADIIISPVCMQVEMRANNTIYT
jgi:hypothetical protein